MTMKLFRRSRKAKKKWRSKAMFIDLHKTKVIITHSKTSEKKPKQVPSWVFRKLDPSIADIFARSNVRNQYASETDSFINQL